MSALVTCPGDENDLKPSCASPVQLVPAGLRGTTELRSVLPPVGEPPWQVHPCAASHVDEQ